MRAASQASRWDGCARAACTRHVTSKPDANGLYGAPATTTPVRPAGGFPNSDQRHLSATGRTLSDTQNQPETNSHAQHTRYPRYLWYAYYLQQGGAAVLTVWAATNSCRGTRIGVGVLKHGGGRGGCAAIGYLKPFMETTHWRFRAAQYGAKKF